MVKRVFGQYIQKKKKKKLGTEPRLRRQGMLCEELFLKILYGVFTKRFKDSFKIARGNISLKRL